MGWHTMFVPVKQTHNSREGHEANINFDRGLCYNHAILRSNEFFFFKILTDNLIITRKQDLFVEQWCQCDKIAENVKVKANIFVPSAE